MNGNGTMTTWTGEQIRAARKAANMTYRGLGDLIGVSGQAVQKWERGETVPNYDHREALTRIFVDGNRDKPGLETQVRQLTNELRWLRSAVAELQDVVARLVAE